MVGLVLAVILGGLVVIYRWFMEPYDFFEKQGIKGPKPSFLFGNWWKLWQRVSKPKVCNYTECPKSNTINVFNTGF
jgi:hypothetical protein